MISTFVDLTVSSNEWDTVFDPCVGSWTTTVASKKLNRNYIIADINKNYINLVYDRLENEV